MYKNEFTMDKRPECKTQNYNIVEENLTEDMCDLGPLKKKIGTLDFVKVKTFSCLKVFIRKQRGKSQAGRKCLPATHLIKNFHPEYTKNT